MIIRIGIADYKIHFCHDVPNRLTECRVHSTHCKGKPCDVEALQGIAKCSPKDQFSRREGRKISFAKAISVLPREVRRDFWFEYFKQAKQ